MKRPTKKRLKCWVALWPDGATSVVPEPRADVPTVRLVEVHKGERVVDVARLAPLVREAIADEGQDSERNDEIERLLRGVR